MQGLMSRKVGILGGTFDPIHDGHIMMAESAFRQFGLDEIRLMPNGSPPHKNDRYITARPSERLEMTRLAADELNARPGEEIAVTVLDYEIRRRRTSYSYETMEYFTSIEPDTEFYFIVGADSLMALDTWMKPERLLKTCVMLAAVRGGDDTSALKQRIKEYDILFPGCDIRILSMPRMDISSTDLRARLLEGQSISGLVPASVEKYIADHPDIYNGTRMKGTSHSS